MVHIPSPWPSARHSGLLFAAVLAAAATGADALAQKPPPTVSPAEAAFLAENNKAMDTMMAAMTVHPSGDIDRDFVAMMVPHHQGAIDMARAELRYGHNEQLRRMAQEIIVTQQQEIAVMRQAIQGSPPPNGQAPDAADMHHHAMPSK